MTGPEASLPVESQASSVFAGNRHRKARRDAIALLLATAAIASILSWLQFTTPSICCGDFDGYYHIRWSQLMWKGVLDGEFPPSFIWLPLTTLNPRDYADQHFLFHFLLIPFTWSGNLTKGAKTAAVVFSTLAILSCYWLLLRYKVRHDFLFFLALMSSSAHFFYRLNSARASSLSIIYMTVAIVLLFERRYVWLAPLGFLYAWTYNLFLFLGVITVCWITAVWWTRRRIEWHPAFWAGLGMVSGMVINPYFPHDFKLLAEHLFAKAGQYSIAPGIEWQAFPSWILVERSFVACAAMVLGYMGCGYLLALEPYQRRHAERPMFFLLFSSFLLLITLRSRRFTEYWPPFAVLFAAFTLAALWDARSESQAQVVQQAEYPQRSKRERMWRVTAVSVVLAAMAIYNLDASRTIIAAAEANKTPRHYSGGMKWVQDHVPIGARIYNVNWPDFPKLFFYDTSHTYVAGLDPTYLLDQSPQLMQLYERIATGQESHPAAIIRDRFGANHVMLGNLWASPGSYPGVLKTEGFAKVYEDNETIILKILP